MAYDANLVLQTLVTKTASFDGTGLDLKTGTPKRGMTARFVITSYGGGATAGATFTPKIQESDDNTTFTDVAAAPTLTGATAAATKILPVSFVTGKRYVRASMVLTGAASLTPSIAYYVDLGMARDLR